MGAIQDTFRTVRLGGWSVTANLTKDLTSKAMRCERQANLLNRVLGERADVNDDRFPRTPTKDDIEPLWQGLQKYIWAVVSRSEAHSALTPDSCYFVGCTVEHIVSGIISQNQVVSCIGKFRKDLRWSCSQYALLSCFSLGEVFRSPEPIFTAQHSLGEMK